MQIIDITQELFSGKVYPNDPAPSFHRDVDMKDGAVYNLSSFQMGAHNATHLDAPFHFYKEGKTIDQLDLSKCIGPCTLVTLDLKTLSEIEELLASCHKRLLIKGRREVTLEMAKLFNHYNIALVGVEGQSVGSVDSPMPVHLELLGKEVVLLEGLVLEHVVEGDYYLFAAPMKLGGLDGSPCRAILLKNDESRLVL